MTLIDSIVKLIFSSAPSLRAAKKINLPSGLGQVIDFKENNGL
jgi:hypothetical protein